MYINCLQLYCKINLISYSDILLKILFYLAFYQYDKALRKVEDCLISVFFSIFFLFIETHRVYIT